MFNASYLRLQPSYEKKSEDRNTWKGFAIGKMVISCALLGALGGYLAKNIPGAENNIPARVGIGTGIFLASLLIYWKCAPCSHKRLTESTDDIHETRPLLGA